MLSTKEIKEIREHLEKAQNPVFFFDNDCDGLISFVLLRRKLGRGKGVAIKSFPGLDKGYVRRIEELNADYVFILDKPIVDDGFFEEVGKLNIPIVWIDHHDVKPFENVSESNKSAVNYYNPIYSKEKSSEPVSYLCYKIADDKKDIWLAMTGCISDNFMPEFGDEFAKGYPELWKKDARTAFEVLYECELGKLINMFNYGLKDRTSNVIAMLNFLVKVNSPEDILMADEHLQIVKRYKQVDKIYSKILEKAKVFARSSKKFIFFQYGSDLSMSADLANELSYRFPSKVIMVVRVVGAIATASIRGKIDVRDLTLRAIEGIEGATGGGHENATGARMNVDDLEKFRKFFEENVN